MPPVLSVAHPIHPAAAADQLPSALLMTEERWQRHYNFPKPGPYEPVVMQCRTNRRAAWAAQLAHDAGLQNCYVYRQASTGTSSIAYQCFTCGMRVDGGRYRGLCLRCLCQ